MNTGDEFANEYTWFVLKVFLGVGSLTLGDGGVKREERRWAAELLIGDKSSRGSLQNQQLGLWLQHKATSKPSPFIAFQHQTVEVKQPSAGWVPLCFSSLIVFDLSNEARSHEEREREKKRYRVLNDGCWCEWLYFFPLFHRWMWRREKHFGGWLLTNERSLPFDFVSFVGMGKEQPPFHLYVCVCAHTCLAASLFSG